MHIIHLGEDDLRNIRTFLARTDLKGHEVDAFNKLVQKIESPMPQQKTPGEIIDGTRTKKLVEKILDREDFKDELDPIINRYYSHIANIVDKNSSETTYRLDSMELENEHDEDVEIKF